MAILDPTKFSALREAVPELSDTEFSVALLFSHGANVEEICEICGMSKAMVRKTLYLSKNKLNLPSSNSINVVIHLRLSLILLERLS